MSHRAQAENTSLLNSGVSKGEGMDMSKSNAALFDVVPSNHVVWNIRFVFFLEAAALTSLFPRFPDLKAQLGLSYSDLGLSLLGLPIGTLISLGLGGAIVERIGTRKASLLGLMAIGITLWGPPQAFSMLSLFLTLMLVGLSLALIEIGMNVDADRIEKWVGRPIMSSAHGFWSLGALAGTAMGAWAAGQGLSIATQMLVLSPVLCGAAMGLILMRPKIPVAPPTSYKNPTFALPTKAMLGMCFFAVGLQMSEGAAFDWSGIYMRDVVGGNAQLIGAAYFAFTLPMALGRFAGDGLRARIGPVRLARASTLIGCTGLLFLGLGSVAWTAALGWALLGLGASVAFPLAVTAAAERADRPAPVNVASVFLISFTAFVIGPPMIGILADWVGLQWALLSLLPFCMAGFILAPSLKSQT